MYFGNCCIPSCHTEATNYRQHLLKRVVQCEPPPQPSCLYTVLSIAVEQQLPGLSPCLVGAS